jgi:CBS domain-containing protein
MARSIQDVMTRDLVTLDGNATLLDAADAMRKHEIGDVLVTRDAKLIGILTDRDIVVRGLAHRKNPTSAVADICSRDPVTIDVGEPLETAVTLMRQHAIRRIPVVEGGEPVGIVSLGDLAEERDPDSVLGRISQAEPTH